VDVQGQKRETNVEKMGRMKGCYERLWGEAYFALVVSDDDLDWGYRQEKYRFLFLCRRVLVLRVLAIP